MQTECSTKNKRAYFLDIAEVQLIFASAKI